MRYTELYGQWHDNPQRGNMKGRENVFKASNSMAMLGTILLNVVRVVHGERDLS